MSDYSDQEISLRPYIEAVLSKWYWILGLGLLAGIIAYVATTVLVSPTYEATALVSITEPRQRVQFDPRIITVEENQPLRAYPEIARSDELLSTLQSESAAASAFSLLRLRSLLKAIPVSDPRWLRITAVNAVPDFAAAVVNAWAELFVSWANRTFGDSSEEQLFFFEQRLEDAEAELEEAEDALVEFQAQNRSTVLANELEVLERVHANLLAKEGEIELLSQDIESLMAVTQDAGASGSPTYSDQFTTLVLKLRAFGGPASEENVTFPWQLQVNADNLSAESIPDLEQEVLNLRAALAIQANQTQAALQEIEPRILAVQKEKQEANATQSALQRNIDLAKDTHTALARTVEEKRITSQDTNTGVNLASRSSVPTFPTGPQKLLNVLAAFIAVSLLVVFVIILITWWRVD